MEIPDTIADQGNPFPTRTITTTSASPETNPPSEQHQNQQDVLGPAGAASPQSPPDAVTQPLGVRRRSRDSMGMTSPGRPHSRTGLMGPSPTMEYYDGPVKSSSVRSTGGRPVRFTSIDDGRAPDDDYYYAGPANYPNNGNNGYDMYRDDGGRPRSDRYTRRSSQSHPPRAYMNRQYNLGAPSPVSTMGGKTVVLDDGHSSEEYHHPNAQNFYQPQYGQKRPVYRGAVGTNSTGPRMRDEEMGFESSGGEGGAQRPGSPQRIEWRNLSAEEKVEVLRLPFTHWMHSDFKNNFVAGLGEFVGTTMFLLIAFAGTTVANTQSQASPANGNDTNTTTGASTGFDVSVLLYISIIFGFSLMVNVWVFFRISGGLFNPAVTLAMLLVRAITPKRAVWLFTAQMLGSMLASVIVLYLLPQRFNVKTTLSNGTTLVQGVFIEAILTAQLVFTIFMLAMEKHRATFIAPVGIGLALFIAEMVGVQFTGGSLNPARSFGPCVVTLSFDAEHWVYWVGPFVGALIAVIFYKFIKTLEYEMANPGADGDPLNDPTQNPEKLAELKSRPSIVH